MKKVRVLKEMPFFKVGEQLNVTEEGFVPDLNGYCVNELIREGWVEKAEERKTLADKLEESYKFWDFQEPDWTIIALVARDHYLKAFNQAAAEWSFVKVSRGDIKESYKDHLRRAIEEA